MANKVAILDKIARNLGQRGVSVSRGADSSVVVDNGANDLTITYVAKTLASPMGGVDPTVSPYLGIGIAEPGKIKVKSAIHTAGTIADVLDSVVAATVLMEVSGFGNDIVLENDNASFSQAIRGDADRLGMGA